MLQAVRRHGELSWQIEQFDFLRCGPRAVWKRWRATLQSPCFARNARIHKTHTAARLDSTCAGMRGGADVAGPQPRGKGEGHLVADLATRNKVMTRTVQGFGLFSSRKGNFSRPKTAEKLKRLRTGRK